MYALAWMDGSFPWTQLMYIFQFFSVYIQSGTKLRTRTNSTHSLTLEQNESILWVCPHQTQRLVQADLVLLHFPFAVLYRYYVYKLKVCGKLKVASSSVPFFQWHLLSLCLFLVLLTISNPPITKRWWLAGRLRWWLESFSNKVF